MRPVRILVIVCSLLASRLWAYDGARPWRYDELDHMPTGVRSAAEEQMEEAAKQADQGNLAAAEKIYRQMLDGDSSSFERSEVLDKLGDVLLRAAKYKDAEAVFKKALAEAPNDAYACCALGFAYYATGQDEAANVALKKAVKLKPVYAEPHQYLGLVAFHQGHADRAQRELEIALALDPEDADAIFNLAWVFAFKKPPDKAKAYEYYRWALLLGTEREKSIEEFLGWHEEGSKIGSSLTPRKRAPRL